MGSDGVYVAAGANYSFGAGGAWVLEVDTNGSTGADCPLGAPMNLTVKPYDF